jgi:hypothetical protein
MKALCWMALLVLLAAGCGRQGEGDRDVSVELKVAPEPAKVGPAQVTLVVKDADDKPVQGATLKLEGNMAHAGMKPVFADAREEKAGLYRAGLEFTMGGDWFILVDGTLANGRSFRKKIDVKGVRSD